MCCAHSAWLIPTGASIDSVANRPPTPSRLIATVNSPDTAPPRSAVCSASFSDVVAAAATRMLVRIETHMPT
jgi:hypothetical protein